jgi:hypothetical protein
MDMQFYWIEDRIKQGQFRVFWAPSDQNKGNYLQNALQGHIINASDQSIYTLTILETMLRALYEGVLKP